MIDLGGRVAAQMHWAPDGVNMCDGEVRGDCTNNPANVSCPICLQRMEIRGE